MEDCIFCKIRDGIIPKEFTYKDEDIMVFPDIYPLKPIHLLIVPKKHMGDLLIMNDEGLMIKLTRIVQEMIRKQNLTGKGYRVVINGGGAQIINHLHLHLLGPLGEDSPH